jgi:hypothetical protein
MDELIHSVVVRAGWATTNLIGCHECTSADIQRERIHRARYLGWD